MKNAVPYLLVAVTFLAIGISIVLALDTPERQWEHGVIQTVNSEATDTLMDLEKDGWQLIEVTPNGNTHTVLWLRRRQR